jgi:hypothetical protein
LQDRFCYVPLDVIVPGILERADIADVVAALAPRAVLLEGLVDGRDRSVSAAVASQELRAALTAYQREPSRLMIRDRAAAPGLAAWIAAELFDRAATVRERVPLIRLKYGRLEH